MDFASVDLFSPLLLQYDFGPGTDLMGTGTMVLYGSTPGGEGGQRRLVVDAFYIAPPNVPVMIGDPCPLNGSELLPPDEIFPLTLFVLGGVHNKTVYACGASTVVGVAVFEYVGQASQVPSFISTPFPTLVSSGTVEPCSCLFQSLFTLLTLFVQ